MKWNDRTGTCTECYNAYYLDFSNICREMNQYCKNADRAGNCVSCYENYKLTSRGTCIYNALGLDSRYPSQQENPICSEFSGNTCLTCVQGAYKNRYGICKLPDRNCEKFDFQNECCKVCMIHYTYDSTARLCKP